MSRVPLASGSLVLLATSFLGVGGCSTTEIKEFTYPTGSFSALDTDFGEVVYGSTSGRTLWFKNNGELPMGISSITPGEGDASDQFAMTWTSTEVECPDTTPAADEATARTRATLDSGGLPPPDTSADTGDTGGSEEPSVIVLGSGCSLPIHITYAPTTTGRSWGSVIVKTATERNPESGDPSYFADPLAVWRMAYLSGSGLQSEPNVVVNPYALDFGHLWTGETTYGYVTIDNTGTGPLTLSDPVLDVACSAAFSIVDFDDTTFQRVLEPGQATFVKIRFEPLDTRSAECRLTVNSDDPDAPRVDVTVTGNAGSNTENEPPTVAIRTPYNGYQHTTRDELAMEINVFDANQPATTLECRVKSMIVEQDMIADCTPTDASGHVILSLPIDKVNGKVDTIRVQVTDGEGAEAMASVSVLVNAPFPEDDDDGDGWGETPDEDGWYDCDDTNVNTYPEASEVPDGADNDCDGTFDEGTVEGDDDLDGWTENEGDCNDLDITVFPGALELPDEKDNDCDEIVDEGTAKADSDGDGYTDNDCNDSDANTHPGATEYCDSLDNDCNGLTDDDCVPMDPPPYIVGGINMQQTSCEEGEEVTMSVFVYDADDTSLDFAWQGDAGLVIDPLSGSSTVTVTCPTLPSGSISNYGITAVVTDSANQSDWDFTEITVYRKGELYLTEAVIVPKTSGTCSTGARPPFVAVGFLALAAALARRRAR